MEVRDPDPVPLGGSTQRRTLGMLLVNAGQTVSIDQLVDGIWPNDDAPDRAEQNVPKYVHRLRTVFGERADRIQTVGAGYRLDLEPDELDATRFERLVDGARAATADGDSGRALQLLDEALALWNGRPYDDVADLDWARGEVTRLSEVRASAIERRFELLLGEGRHTELVGPLQEAIGDEPWRERRRAQLALALYRAGRQAEALRVIKDYRSELIDELGLDPSAELDELEHRILDHDPSLQPGPQRSHVVRGYQLDEVIGEGAFSLVWRGTQPTLDRTVAVKQIRAELANQAEFIRGFETEAQTIAALEHPHIVPLYDYWREPDSAFLVMRYVAGGSLEAAVLSGPLDEDRLRRMVEQVGAALHTAHRAGVLHRDVKTANVLLDGDGNFYLSDFGIAFTGVDDELAASLSTGSPAYAAPEQLRRQDLDPRTDVYSFGITLFEAATGRLPFVDAPNQAAMVSRQLHDPVPTPSSVDPSVPPWVDDIVARATAKNPGDRFATIDDLLAAVPVAGSSQPDGGGSAWPTLVSDLVNPFKALRAFRESDAADFHGRDRLITRFVQVLERPGAAGRMLAAVGPSGSGKSSVVRSGLLPALRKGALPGSDRWFIATMLPGNHPFDALEAALTRVASRPTGPLVEMMRGDTRGIIRAVGQALPDEESELVLVIDQFEELFTLTDETTRTAFIDGLLTAVREPRANLRVVVTIRADFWDRPLRHPQLAARLETAAVTVSPLAPDELEAAIVEPVRTQGVKYEPGLVARIIADVGDQPGALPLLQYALTELFETQVSGLILGESYDEFGGLAGALANRADAALTAMSEDQQEAARRLFCRLVTLGEGTEDTRRRVRLAELGDDPDTEAVIAAFGESRMLVFDVDPTTREPTVEISHEALLRAWPRLRTWLDDDRDGLRIHRHLTEATTGWLVSGRDPGELYRGGRLEAVETWAADHADDLNAAERDFLQASLEQRQTEFDAEAERYEEQVRHNRRLRTLVGVATVIALVAAAAGLFAFGQRSRANDEAAAAEEGQRQAEEQRVRAEEGRQEAERERQRADLERVRATAFDVLETDPALAALLAAEADRIEPSAESKDVLHRVLNGTDGVERIIPASYTDLWLADGGATAVGIGDDGVHLWDLRTGDKAVQQVERDLGWETIAGSPIDVSDAGGLIAVADEQGVDVHRLGSDEPEWSLDRQGIVDVVFSPDGAEIAVAATDRIEIWRLDGSGTPTRVLPGAVTVAWRPGGDGVVLMTPEHAVEYWPAAATEAAWSEAGFRYESQEPRMMFNNAGDEVLVTQSFTRNQEILLRLLSLEDGSQIGQTVDVRNFIDDWMWLDDQERQLGLAGRLQSMLAVDIDTGRATDPPFFAPSAWTIDWSEALAQYVVGGPLGIALHDPTWSGPLEDRLPVVTDPAAVDFRGGPGAGYRIEEGINTQYLALSSAGDRVLATVFDWPTVIATQDAESASRFGGEFDLSGAAVVRGELEVPGIYKGRGGRMVQISGDGVSVVDERFQRLGPPAPFEGLPNNIGISPDGRFFVVHWMFEAEENTGNSAVLYAADGTRVTGLVVPGRETGFFEFSFSGDGSRLVGHNFGDDEWAIWDTATGEIVDSGPGPGKEFTRPWLAGDTLYARDIETTGEPDFTLRRLDPETYEEVGEPIIGLQAERASIIDHASSELIITKSFDGVVRLWDRESGSQVGRPFQDWYGAPPRSMQISDDGKVVANINAAYVSVWDLDVDNWANVACKFAGRNMTADEWAEFGPDTLEHRATCPEYPLES